nr:MAG TPA: hypothetical protein [Caudoviricetes sp.]
MKLQGYSSQRRIPHSGEPGAIPGNLLRRYHIPKGCGIFLCKLVIIN